MAENVGMKNVVSLILGPEWLTEIKNSTIKACTDLQDLLGNVSQQRNNNYSFRLFILSQYLKQLIDNDIHNLPCIDSIHSYYNSVTEYDLHTHYYRNTSDKLRFIMTTGLVMRLLDVSQTPNKQEVSPVGRTLSKITPMRQRKINKSRGFAISNRISSDLKCPMCSKIYEEPYQLLCGHRQCKSCIDKQQGTIITCTQCQETTPNDEAWLDRGFKKHIEESKKLGIAEDQ